ncbi:hypothetical protein POF50_004205 [Streptomyces sp. SL13]|uniref:Uncharacterized protein n=1 Tax=Streptantibioticus silvisoli TaxID=2705255 RepID=A0AA90GY55_9ACTN|nr:hypothetical protein [Streptantibioticus silvisoli]MDI5968556.1 hypothetical protein [Streptantibioticus silvisoli]
MRGSKTQRTPIAETMAVGQFPEVRRTPLDSLTILLLCPAKISTTFPRVRAAASGP